MVLRWLLLSSPTCTKKAVIRGGHTSSTSLEGQSQQLGTCSIKGNHQVTNCTSYKRSFFHLILSPFGPGPEKVRNNICKFEQAPGDGEGQGSLGCFSPWDHQESDMTEQQFDQERYINMRFSNLVQKKNKERGPKRC